MEKASPPPSPKLPRTNATEIYDRRGNESKYINPKVLSKRQELHQSEQKALTKRALSPTQNKLIPTEAVGKYKVGIILFHAHHSHQEQDVFLHDTFNRLQSACFQLLFHSNESAVVTGAWIVFDLIFNSIVAPTGAGKTGVLELAICQMLKEHHHKSSMVVYIAPLKALCHERVLDWTEKFKRFLKCKELTGDTKENISSKCNFVVTTPEKWDVFTKNSTVS